MPQPMPIMPQTMRGTSETAAARPGPSVVQSSGIMWTATTPRATIMTQLMRSASHESCFSTSFGPFMFREYARALSEMYRFLFPRAARRIFS